jgi:hypothetical protein
MRISSMVRGKCRRRWEVSDTVSVPPGEVNRQFGFQRGVTVARSFQLGPPAYRSARIR